MTRKNNFKTIDALVLKILDLDGKELSSIQIAIDVLLKEHSPPSSIGKVDHEGDRVRLELSEPISSSIIGKIEETVVSTINSVRAEEYFSVEEKDEFWEKLNTKLVNLPVSPTTIVYFKSQPSFLGRFVGELVQKKYEDIVQKKPRIISKTSLNEVVEILKGFGLSLGMKKTDLAGWGAPSLVNPKILHEEEKVEQLPISMDTPLSILDKYDVSSHTLSKLGKHYRTIGELCQATEADLRVQGRTVQPILKIQIALKKLGLKLKE